MKFLLLAGMLIVSVIHFLGSPVHLRPAGVLVSGNPAVAQEQTLNGEWYLLPALSSDTATGKLPFLRFDAKSNTFSGFTGCNQMSGYYSSSADILKFNQNINLSKKICPGYNEQEFVSNLLRVDHFRITDGVLWLLIDQTPVARWTRRPGGKGVM